MSATFETIRPKLETLIDEYIYYPYTSHVYVHYGMVPEHNSYFGNDNRLGISYVNNIIEMFKKQRRKYFRNKMNMEDRKIAEQFVDLNNLSIKVYARKYQIIFILKARTLIRMAAQYKEEITRYVSLIKDRYENNQTGLLELVLIDEHDLAKYVPFGEFKKMFIKILKNKIDLNNEKSGNTQIPHSIINTMIIVVQDYSKYITFNL